MLICMVMDGITPGVIKRGKEENPSLSRFWSESIYKCGIFRSHVGGIWRARKCGIFQHAIPISWQLLSGKQTLCKLEIMINFRAISSSFTWDMAFIAMFAYYSGTRPRVQPWIPGIARMWFFFSNHDRNALNLWIILGPIFLGCMEYMGGKKQERLDELELGCSWNWNSEIWRCPGLGVPQVTMGLNTKMIEWLGWFGVPLQESSIF